MKLIAQKWLVKNKMKSEIEKYSKQEQIILKVLDISNREENKGLFEKEDELINKDLDEVKKQWEAQRKQLDMNKRLKENYSDFDYFAANADW